MNSSKKARTNQIADLADAGHSIVAISRKLGLRRQCISRHLKKSTTEEEALRRGKSEEEVLLGQLFKLSSEQLRGQLRQREIKSPHILLGIMKTAGDQKMKRETAPAKELVNALFGSVMDRMLCLTLGPHKNPEPATICPNPLEATRNEK